MTKKTNAKSGRVAEVRSAANKNDVIMNRVLCVLLYTLVVLISIFSIHNNNSAELFVVGKLGIPLLVVSAVLLAVAVAFRIKNVKSGVNEEMKVINSSVCLFAAGVIFAICWAYRIAFIEDMDALIVAVIAATVCYFVYYMYPLPMFSYSVAAAFGVVIIRVLTNHANATGTLASVARIGTMVYGIIIAVLAFIAQKNDGKLFGLKVGKGSGVWFTLITAVILVAAGVVAMLYPAFLGYMTIVYVAMYLILIVIGTVLMI